MQMSTILNKTCEGGPTTSRQMFTLLGRYCTATPTKNPTGRPTRHPSRNPTDIPTRPPTRFPSSTPTYSCSESRDFSELFPSISGAVWEYKQNWDCPYQDLGRVDVSLSVSGRKICADRCLANNFCTSFVMGSDKCWWKHTKQMSTILNKTCEGVTTSSRQMFTLLGR